jgi:hypothetical protein
MGANGHGRLRVGVATPALSGLLPPRATVLASGLWRSAPLVDLQVLHVQPLDLERSVKLRAFPLALDPAARALGGRHPAAVQRSVSSRELLTRRS